MEELNLNRRGFIKGSLSTAALLAMGFNPISVFAEEDFVKLTILHTNDVHSRIDPFPMDGSRNQGKAGVAPRATLINKIRKEEKNVLLLDAGDIFQGTPYFNYWGGELEIKMMSMMGYDAAIMGNHDFDNGVEGFAKQLPHAKFPILNANYDFTNTALEGKTKGYQIFNKGDLKIGVYGLGIELTGLVNQQQYGETQYTEPIKKALEMERFLKQDQKCDLVICLSHLGFKYRENKVSDMVLAQNIYFTDLIIGGHTHTFLSTPESVKNLSGKETLVNQVGFAGINLGRIDYVFTKEKKKKITYSSAIEVVENNFKI
ncbi:bifunctional metallophosphatase/5'-nucleotidase [Pedobacter glucosidilyticus]|uniref:bifunctional metallophosphatase/5'-nucleotidase n=1 Tax=Pedobacter glucosidilyticus TaxID=1122941 RepID=UPI00040B6981|nr:metallophosphatase [Pedobacter glucosidilyticus]